LAPQEHYYELKSDRFFLDAADVAVLNGEGTAPHTIEEEP